ncbi:pyroglutamyl-peptidase I [Georgenia wangjunii]|uniref:pyroglutamyl-peptidase I n=1 Tax=Georgenia wangjunii TaxID=3117730 RepID=UPI002F265F5C
MSSSTVLVTGFDPFDGQAVNASWAAVEALAERWPADGPRLETLRLPVTFAGAGPALRGAVEATRPDLVVCVGEAGGRDRIGLERVAVNVVDARIPDNDGAQPVDVPVVAGAPTAYLSALPVKACVQALARAGLPAEVSNTAGTYVCNATFYALMHLVEGTGVRAGFVHVPRLAGDAADGPASGAALTAEDLARGLDVIVRAALRTGEDLPLPGGAED